MQTYIVYSTDAWLSTSSYTICGTFVTKLTAIKSILRHLNVGEKVTEEECLEIEEQLKEYNQTQGYRYNYVIECYTNGEWVE